MLRLTDITVRLDGFALRVEALELMEGEYLVILGPNGAGKTVLLEAVAGLHPLETGRIETHTDGDWSDMTGWPPERRMIGFVYQDYLLFPHLSVAGNIGFGLQGRMPAKDRAVRVREVAALTGVEDMLQRRVGGLSGGEQQKVALARALAIRPGLLLLDEPLAALDRTARREMAAEVRCLCRELGVTVLHVTHSLEEAVSLGDRVAVLAGGRLLQIDSPAQLLRRPVDQTVAGLVGCGNLLAGVARDRSVALDGGPVLPIDEDRQGEVTVGLRAEELTLEALSGDPVSHDGAYRFTGLVESLEPGPAHWTALVRFVGVAERSGPPAAGGRRAPEGKALADSPLEEAAAFRVFVMPPELVRLGVSIGSSVRVRVDPSRVHVFAGR